MKRLRSQSREKENRCPVIKLRGELHAVWMFGFKEWTAPQLASSCRRISWLTAGGGCAVLNRDQTGASRRERRPSIRRTMKRRSECY